MSSGIILKDVVKGYTYDQDKVVAPEETLARVKARLAALDSRILLKTMRIDTGRLGIPVYISLCGPDAVALTGTQKQMGKGLTPVQSETSALMELMERYSFFSYLNNPPAQRASLAQVADQALDPDLLFLSLHDDKTDRRAGRELLADLPLDWVWARNLTEDRDQLIPLDWFYLINEYNGPSAGNSLEEAICQGLAEVVERHAASVVDHGKLTTPTVDPASLPAGPAREALDRFAAEGIVLHLKDFSLNTGIPTVAGLAWDPATLGASEIVFQAGTTTDPVKSVIRALAEVAQMAADFKMATEYRPTLPKFSSLAEAEYLTRAESIVPVSALPNLADDNIKIEIEAQVAALKRIGLPVFAVDITHPQLDIPAVYVIVPGAHFRMRTLSGSVLFHAAKLASDHPEDPACRFIVDRAAALAPDDYQLRFLSGLALERAGQPDEALERFRQALAAGPSQVDRPAIEVHVGVSLKDMGRFDEALEVFSAISPTDETAWEVHHLTGFCHYNLADYEAAIEAFTKAIEANPGSGIDYANIGSCLRNMGQTGEAVRMYKMALELDPGLDFARDNIAKLAQA